MSDVLTEAWDRVFITEEARLAYREAKERDAFRPGPTRSALDARNAPLPPPKYIIDKVMVEESNSMLAAEYKSGKTTLLLNVTSSLVTGMPFLSEFEVDVSMIAGNIGFMNFELSQRQFELWMGEHFHGVGVTDKQAQRVIASHERGSGLLLDTDFSVEHMTNLCNSNDIEILIIDPITAAVSGTMSADDVARRVIRNIEAVKRDTGVTAIIMSTHTGHLHKEENGRATNERAIGSVAWSGWPDSLWYFGVDQDVDDKPRFFSVPRGRDVDVPEGRVSFHAPSRRLGWVGGTRLQARAQIVLSKISDAGPGGLAIAGMSQGEKKQASYLEQSGLAEKIKLPKKAGVRGAPPEAWVLTPQGRWAL